MEANFVGISRRECTRYADIHTGFRKYFPFFSRYNSLTAAVADATTIMNTTAASVVAAATAAEMKTGVHGIIS